MVASWERGTQTGRQVETDARFTISNTPLTRPLLSSTPGRVWRFDPASLPVEPFVLPVLG